VQYVRETFLYLKHVFFKLGLICLPAAVALGFCIRPVSAVTFLPAYANENVSRGFSDILRLVAGEYTLKYVVLPLILAILLLLTFCFMFSFIEKHFRIGRTMFKKSFFEINNYFIPVFKIILILSGVLLVFYALAVSGVTLQHYIFSGEGTPNAGSVVVAALWTAALSAVLVWLCSPLIFMVPLMQIYGYTFMDAFRSSLSYYGNHSVKITLGLGFGFLVVGAAGLIVAILDQFIQNWYWVQTTIHIALHWLLLIYIGAYSMVTAFSVTGMERKDNRRYY